MYTTASVPLVARGASSAPPEAVVLGQEMRFVGINLAPQGIVSSVTPGVRSHHFISFCFCFFDDITQITENYAPLFSLFPRNFSFFRSWLVRQNQEKYKIDKIKL